MKKFLTVLLVIAVMFTFSFGSAFAVGPTADQKAQLLDAEKSALTQAEANLTIAIGELGDVNDATSGYTIKNAAWEAIKADAMTAIQELITDKTDAQIANCTITSLNVSDTVKEVYVSGTDLLYDVSTIKAILTETDALVLKAAKAQYASDKAEVLKKLDAVDWSLYSGTTPKTDKTYLQQAKEKVAGLVDQVNAAATMTTVAEVKAKADANTGIINTNLTMLKVGTTAIDSGMYKLSDASILTIEQEANNSLNEVAVAAAVKGEVQKKYAAYMTTGTPDKDKANAFVTVYNLLADEAIFVTPTSVKDVAATNFASVVKNISELKTFAEKYKAEKDANGNIIRDAKAVDDIVTKATKFEYANAEGQCTATNYPIAKAKDDIVKTVKDSVAADLAFEKDARKYIIEEARKAALEDYYPLEQVKVNAEYDKLIADIDKATTVGEVKLVTASSLTGINDSDDVDALFVTGTLAGAFVDQYAIIEKYVDYKNAGKTSRDAGYIDETTLSDNLVNLYGEKGARTEAEMKALAADAQALVDALPTVGGIATAKTAVEAAIKAIPATVAVADKATVEAAWKAMNDYVDMTGVAQASETDISNKATLATKIDKLHSAMALDLAKKAVAAGKTDKAALKAVQAEIDAFNDMHDEDEMFEGMTEYTDTTVETALSDIRAAELKAVKAAINAIPINVTEADRATVEAARALYDAFVAEYNDYEEPYNAPQQIDNFRELALAEATLGLNDTSLITVEALKIKASSTVKKGSITIKWTADGETAEVEAYEIWKSTKKSSGFKKAFTTSKTSYKNTKGLKAGTRYYYKVRAIAYDDNGAKVKSDWSNKAYRVAK